MVTTLDLVTALINSKHGWAVAEQFQSTFQGEDFVEQNWNALKYILGTVDELLKSELLNEFPQDELQDYRDALADHMQMMRSTAG